MNLRDLRYLVAAADTEHFGRAAERCHVSQPTLSGQIRKLEETLGIALFERSHRSVALTDAGREITAHARDILERVRRMEELALSRRDALVGPLRIGVIPTLCAYLLPHLLPVLWADSPDLRPVMSEEITEILLGRLRDHEIDVALIATREGTRTSSSRRRCSTSRCGSRYPTATRSPRARRSTRRRSPTRGFRC